MEIQNNNHQFKEDEIAYIRRWDKDRNEYISNPYPKIGGRLRLAHEHNETLSIETEIVRYDEQIAVVSAVATTVIGCFKGIGMASVQRDEKIAPAILEWSLRKLGPSPGHYVLPVMASNTVLPRKCPILEMETVGMVITPSPIKMTVCQPGEIVMTTTAVEIITIYPPAGIVIVVTETVAHMGQMLTVGTVPVLTVAMVATVMETAD